MVSDAGVDDTVTDIDIEGDGTSAGSAYCCWWCRFGGDGSDVGNTGIGDNDP